MAQGAQGVLGGLGDPVGVEKICQSPAKRTVPTMEGDNQPLREGDMPFA